MMRATSGLSSVLSYWIRRTIARPLVAKTAQLVTSRYIGAVLRLGTTAFAARFLGPADYGIAALVLAYPSLVIQVVGTKCQVITIRYISAFRAEGKYAEALGVCKLAYLIDFFVSIAAGLLVLATGTWFATNVYGLPDQAWLMMVYAGTFPVLSLNSTSTAILTSLGEFSSLAVAHVIHRLVTLASVVGFLSLGYGVSGMVFGFAAGQIGIGLTLFVAAMAALHRDGRGNWWGGSLGSMAPFLREFGGLLGWNYIRKAAASILEFVPLMLLGYYQTKEAAGFYRLAVNIVSVVRHVETSMARVVYPVLSARAARARVEGMESLYATTRRWTLCGGCPTALLSIMGVLALPLLVPWVFGQAYRSAVSSAQILMLGAAFSSVFFWVESMYYATKRVEFFTRRFVAYAGLVTIAAWVCAATQGLIGVVVALAVGRIVFVSTMSMRTAWVMRGPSSVRPGGDQYRDCQGRPGVKVRE